MVFYFFICVLSKFKSVLLISLALTENIFYVKFLPTLALFGNEKVIFLYPITQNLK